MNGEGKIAKRWAKKVEKKPSIETEISKRFRTLDKAIFQVLANTKRSLRKREVYV